MLLVNKLQDHRLAVHLLVWASRTFVCTESRILALRIDCAVKSAVPHLVSGFDTSKRVGSFPGILDVLLVLTPCSLMRPRKETVMIPWPAQCAHNSAA